MKQSLLSILILLLPMVVNAASVEIGGIYYNLNSQTKEAQVTQNPNKYTGDVVIPEQIEYLGDIYNVVSIDDSAFGGCSGLTSITIPNSITRISSRAFRKCSGLTSITIPNSVTSIGFSAFSGCSGLTSITIPNSVTSIGIGAFGACSSLSSIIVESGNRYYNSNNGCNAIFYGNKLIAGCKNSTIPNFVTTIDDSAFGGCSGLISITIPNSVTTIGFDAFGGCSGLTSITIPNSVTSGKAARV